ncbi:THO complex subunitTHOC2 C-terminal domain-containing protein [Entamoeba marina]
MTSQNTFPTLCKNEVNSLNSDNVMDMVETVKTHARNQHIPYPSLMNEMIPLFDEVPLTQSNTIIDVLKHFWFTPKVFTYLDYDSIKQKYTSLCHLICYNPDIVESLPSDVIYPLISNFILNSPNNVDLIFQRSQITKEQTFQLLSQHRDFIPSIIKYLPYLLTDLEYFSTVSDEFFFQHFEDFYNSFCSLAKILQSEKQVQKEIPFQLFDESIKESEINTLKEDIIKQISTYIKDFPTTFNTKLLSIPYSQRLKIYQNLPDSPNVDSLRSIQKILKKTGYSDKANTVNISIILPFIHQAPKEIISFFVENVYAYPNFLANMLFIFENMQEWEIDLMHFYVTEKIQNLCVSVNDNLKQLQEMLSSPDKDFVQPFISQYEKRIEIDFEKVDLLWTCLIKLRNRSGDILFDFFEHCLNNFCFNQVFFKALSLFLNYMEKETLANGLARHHLLLPLCLKLYLLKTTTKWSNVEYDQISFILIELAELSKYLNDENKLLLFEQLQTTPCSIEIQWIFARNIINFNGVTKKEFISIAPQPSEWGFNSESKNVYQFIWKSFWELRDIDIIKQEINIKELFEIQERMDTTSSDDHSLVESIQQCKENIERNNRCNEIIFTEMRELLSNSTFKKTNQTIEVFQRMNWFLTECINKRILLSETDAVYGANFIKMMNKNRVSFVPLILLLDKIFQTAFSSLFVLFPHEAKRIGLFVNEVMKMVNSWSDVNVYNLECQNTLDFCLNTYISYEQFMQCREKWILLLNQQLYAYLQSPDFAYQRLSLSCLIECSQQLELSPDILAKNDEMLFSQDVEVRKLSTKLNSQIKPK